MNYYRGSFLSKLKYDINYLSIFILFAIIGGRGFISCLVRHQVERSEHGVHQQ